jgi:DNA-binding XRE family transcriptional regulator
MKYKAPNLFKKEYEKLKPRYELISQIIDARTKQNITQEELALRVGTQKSNRITDKN